MRRLQGVVRGTLSGYKRTLALNGIAKRNATATLSP